LVAVDAAADDEITGEATTDGVLTVIPPYANCAAETVSRLISRLPEGADGGGGEVVVGGNVVDSLPDGAGETDAVLQVDTGVCPVSGLNPMDSVGLIASNWPLGSRAIQTYVSGRLAGGLKVEYHSRPSKWIGLPAQS
jgi:hypothetical protein